jgi:hypothetical protein
LFTPLFTPSFHASFHVVPHALSRRPRHTYREEKGEKECETGVNHCVTKREKARLFTSFLTQFSTELVASVVTPLVP